MSQVPQGYVPQQQGYAPAPVQQGYQPQYQPQAPAPVQYQPQPGQPVAQYAQQPQQYAQQGYEQQPPQQYAPQQQYQPAPEYPYENVCMFTGQIAPNKQMPQGFLWRPGNGGDQGCLSINVKTRRKSAWRGQDRLKIGYVRLAIFGQQGLALMNQIQTGSIIRFTAEFSQSNFRDQKTGEWRTNVQFSLSKAPQGVAAPFQVLGVAPYVEEQSTKRDPQQQQQGQQGGYQQQAPQQGGYQQQPPAQQYAPAPGQYTPQPGQVVPQQYQNPPQQQAPAQPYTPAPQNIQQGPPQGAPVQQGYAPAPQQYAPAPGQPQQGQYAPPPQQQMQQGPPQQYAPGPQQGPPMPQTQMMGPNGEPINPNDIPF